MAKPHAASTSKSTAASSAPSKSSILRSSFAPSRFQLRLFASVIQGLDSQQLRIHDTTTGRLRSQHSVKPGSGVTCLDWGHSRPHLNGSHTARSRKKDDVLLAYGSNTSDVCIFSPTEGRVTGELSGQHERGVLDFKFSETRSNEAWSIGGDGNLVHWDISSQKALQIISLPEPSVSLLGSTSLPSTLLCASTTPYILRLDTSDEKKFLALDSMKNPIHSLYGSNDSILASDGERYINVYKIGPQENRLSRTLIAHSGIQNLSLDNGDVAVATPDEQQLLASLGKDGVVELFPKPFATPQNMNGELKSRRKDLTQKSAAQIRLVASSNKEVPIFAASIQGPDIVLASVNAGVELNFQKIRWQDEGSGELLFSGVKRIIQVNSASSLASANINGVKNMGKPQVDESSTVVTNGLGIAGSQDAAINVESSAEDDDTGSGFDDDAADRDQEDETPSDEEMQDATPEVPSAVKEVPSEPEEPAFGDLVAAAEPTSKSVMISSAFPQAASFTNSCGALTIPTGMSLGTVLTQALRTNDRSLLEACLHTSDPAIIRNTITRLESGLAGTLISKLAERIVSRPGRYGHLQIWVQHLCVAHGAAISSNVEARERLKTLYRALDQRAKGLNSLLLLKGKLQLVEGQLRFRREIAAQRADAGAALSGRPVNVFVEGGADNWDSEDDYDEMADDARPTKKGARKALDQLIGDDSNNEEDDDGEEMPLTITNGVLSDTDSSSDNEEHSSDENFDVQQKPGGIIDDEAQEEVGSGSASSDDGEDVDTADDEEDEDEEADEEDSEMDSFINDGEISVEDDDELLDDVPDRNEADNDGPEDVPQEKPKAKRRKV